MRVSGTRPKGAGPCAFVAPAPSCWVRAFPSRWPLARTRPWASSTGAEPALRARLLEQPRSVRPLGARSADASSVLGPVIGTIGPDHRFNRARIWYYLTMKTVSIDQLKRNLSAFIAEAAGGEHIVITRHRRPIVSLTRADLEHVHVGSRAGRGALRPLLKSATKGAYLDVLADDRRTPAGRAS